MSGSIVEYMGAIEGVRPKPHGAIDFYFLVEAVTLPWRFTVSVPAVILPWILQFAASTPEAILPWILQFAA